MGICTRASRRSTRPSTAGQGELKQGAETRHEAGANRPQTPRRPRPQTPFPRTMAMISSDPRRSRTGRSRATGRRSHHRQPQQKRHRHARRAHHQVHDPAAPARRARRRTRPAGHHRQDAAPAQTPAQQPDLGPGSGTRPAQTDRRLAGHGRLLLRPALPVAARHQREHQRLLRQYFPKGTDLSVYPEDYLDAVAEELNDRPRKTLGFMKPSEKIIELLDAA